MRAIWIISPIIAIGLTTSAPAQGVDQNSKQQIDQIIAAYHDAWNNHNAAGIAALYTKDAILVTQAPQIVKHGQQDIEKNYEVAFATLPHHDSATADEIIPLGSGEFMSVGAYHLTGSGNNGPTHARRPLDSGVCARRRQIENQNAVGCPRSAICTDREVNVVGKAIAASVDVCFPSM